MKISAADWYGVCGSRHVGEALKKDNRKTIKGADLERMASDFLVASKRCEMAALEALLGTGDLVRSVCDLIHAIQRERGASNLYLGSEGGEFAEEMEEMIGETDAALGALAEVWAGMGERVTPGVDRTRLLNRLAHAAHELACLGALRGKVRELGIRPHEGIEIYSELIRALLAIVFEAADAAMNPRISRILVALFNFMEGKEFAGQERATGAGALARGSVDAAVRKRMLHLIEEQERCFEVFEEFADESSVMEWRAGISGENQAMLEKLRRVACTDGPLPKMGSDFSRRWFECATRRIDGMKGVENRLAGRLQELCREKLAEAREMLDSERVASVTHMDEDGGFVIYCSGTGLKEEMALPPQPGGPLLGRSLLEMLRGQTQRLNKLNEELCEAKEALEDRKLIEKAKGLLMKHRRLNEQEAHKMLRDMAMKQSCRMAEVAGRLVAMEGVWE